VQQDTLACGSFPGYERAVPKARRVPAFVEELKQLGLVRPGSKPAKSLLQMCEQGALEGGLSIALDVQPDEAVGALCSTVGGQASGLRVIDVRKEPFALMIRWGDLEESWDVRDVHALVHNLNDLFSGDAQAKAIAVLGEWEEALQLWCVPKPALKRLFGLREFQPSNEGDLRRAEGDER
jgi:hypothetical protein